MNTQTYRIPLDNKSEVMDRLSKLERTANRLGLAFPSVEYGDPYRVDHRDFTGQIVSSWWLPITLTGEGIDRPVSYGGWKIIGQFNHQYPKVILNRLSDDIKPEYIARFEEKNISYCEHCNKAIQRNNTYVIEKEDGSNQMLVGSNCMHHYVPHQKSVDSVMAYYQSIKEYFAQEDEDDPEGIYRVYEPKIADTKNYLRACFQVLLAGVDMKSDMFTRVLGHLRSGTKPKDDDEVEAFLIKAMAAYEDADSEMYHMMLFIGALSENNDFNVRLKRMCEPGYHMIKDGNTVRWGASKYYDYIHRPRKPPARAANTTNNWVGEVGQVIETQVTFDARIFLYTSEYGDSYLYTFKTLDGNTITWKTSYMDTEFLQGDMILRARVKELTEYKGVKQTQVTRAKLRKI